MNTKPTDAELIKNLGGPSKVAEILCFEKAGGAQRVQNWINRGIPSHIKVQYPKMFMPDLIQAQALDQAPPTRAAEQPIDLA